MERVGAVEGAKVVLLPRNRKQADFSAHNGPTGLSTIGQLFPAKPWTD